MRLDEQNEKRNHIFRPFSERISFSFVSSTLIMYRIKQLDIACQIDKLLLKQFTGNTHWFIVFSNKKKHLIEKIDREEERLRFHWQVYMDFYPEYKYDSSKTS